jgi:ribosomal protein S18 acetylase RimI-like enzyme
MAQLRPATPTDLPQIIALDQQIFGGYGADESPAVIVARLAVFPAGCVVLTDAAAQSETETIVGYLTTEKWATIREPALDEDPRLTHQPSGTILNITTLAIAPWQQGRGLGSQLVAHAIALAQQESCTAIVLETAWAARFYEQHGFTIWGERRQRNILLQIMHYALETESNRK